MYICSGKSYIAEMVIILYTVFSFFFTSISICKSSGYVKIYCILQSLKLWPYQIIYKTNMPHLIILAGSETYFQLSNKFQEINVLKFH